jgi:hypothetical protein
MNNQECRYSHLYQEADTSFLVNWGSEKLRPIRISLPKPPPLHLIGGWGEHPDDQIFKRLENPLRLRELERSIITEFGNKNRGVNGNATLKKFWSTLEKNQENYTEEIEFIRKFVYYMHHGYWFFNDGKPTWLPPWYFSYLNLHRMTTKKGYIFPEFRKKSKERFLFRHYINTCTETFVDTDPETGLAEKIDIDGKMAYRMVDVGYKLLLGTALPKGRREGLTNEFCHIITRIAASQRGADKLCTIVSMDGDNAETHFKQKLMPAWRAWPLWTRPVWLGGFGKMKSLEFTSNGIADVQTLDTVLSYTESGDDKANDGKMLIGAGFDEQGKGKRTGNVQNRWQINKETMSLGGGSEVVGYCDHPSTVEKMEEGGQDYKDLCDMSNFYKRKKDGQTASGLALCYHRSDYCMEGYIDVFGEAIIDMPNERQIMLSKKHDMPIKRIGSNTFIENKRVDLHNEDDPAMMDEYRSFVRKFPQDCKDCWTGVAGQLGFDNELLRERLFELEDKPVARKGRLMFVDQGSLSVTFIEDPNGPWIVSEKPAKGEANQVSTMEAYSAFMEDDETVYRPMNIKYMIGVDPTQFNNQGESRYLQKKGTRTSDTGITVKRMHNPIIDIAEDKRKWITPKAVAFCRHRFGTSDEVAMEAIKAGIYWGGLINLEQNITAVWERIVEKKFTGYLNYTTTVMPDGTIKRASKPGTSLGMQNKKDGFLLLANQIKFHSTIEDIPELLIEADQISSMEELTKFDGLASWIQALIGEQSAYYKLLSLGMEEKEEMESINPRSYRC